VLRDIRRDKMPVLIPILKAGATVVTRVAPAVARRLIKAGKAKPAKGKPGEQLELDLKPPKKTPTPKPKSGKPGEQLELPLRGGGAKVTPKTKPKRKRTSGLKEAAIAGTVVGGASMLGGGTKSVTVKSGDTLSQIAKDNNTTLAAIKKANPNITDIHSIRPGQKVKVPKVKGRKSVYQGLSKSELKGKPPARVKPSKKYPFGFGPDNMGNVVKKASGGKVRKYKEAGSVGGRMLPRIRKPTKPKGVGAATKGWGKTGRH